MPIKKRQMQWLAYAVFFIGSAPVSEPRCLAGRLERQRSDRNWVCQVRYAMSNNKEALHMMCGVENHPPTDPSITLIFPSLTPCPRFSATMTTGPPTPGPLRYNVFGSRPFRLCLLSDTFNKSANGVGVHCPGGKRLASCTRGLHFSLITRMNQGGLPHSSTQKAALIAGVRYRSVPVNAADVSAWKDRA